MYIRYAEVLIQVNAMNKGLCFNPGTIGFVFSENGGGSDTRKEEHECAIGLAMYMGSSQKLRTKSQA